MINTHTIRVLIQAKRAKHSAKHDPGSLLKVAAILVCEQSGIQYMSNALLNVVVGRLAAFVARVPLCVVAIRAYECGQAVLGQQKTAEQTIQVDAGVVK